MTQYNIFEGLTKINEDFSVTPLLAEKWDFSPDLKTLTFTLKRNVKFQDGEAFSSKDVKFSFERFAAKDSTNKDKDFFASIESIDTPDPMTVVLKKIQGAELRGALPPRHGHGCNPRREERGKRGDESGRHRPVQAFVLDEGRLRHARQVGRLSRAGEDPARSRNVPLHFRSVGGESRLCSPATSTPFRASPNFQALEPVQAAIRAFRSLVGGTEGKTILAMNNKNKPLDELKVRQAIAYAIDRKAIIDGAMNGLGTPIGSHLTPNDPGYVDLTGMYPHDPAKAKELLKEAGVTTPLTSASFCRRPQLCAAEAARSSRPNSPKSGFNAKIQEVEWAQWLSGVYKDHNYDLTIISHVEPLDIGIYANPNYYFRLRQPGVSATIYAKVTSAPDLEPPSRRRSARRRGRSPRIASTLFLFQLPNVDGRGREAARPVEERPDLRQRSFCDVVEMIDG